MKDAIEHTYGVMPHITCDNTGQLAEVGQLIEVKQEHSCNSAVCFAAAWDVAVQLSLFRIPVGKSWLITLHSQI